MGKGIFGNLFDFNGDGKKSAFEHAAEFQFLHDVVMAEENEDKLTAAGLDKDELSWMDEDERREALENAGLAPADFDDDFYGVKKMAFKIGFAAERPQNKPAEATYTVPQQTAVPRKSVVQVYFAGRNMTLTYYNDQFDLHCGDMVYVDGKLEGMRGRVMEVNYNFKIKVSDYKRIIAVVDTTVNSQFFMASSHFVTFDREALPSNKVVTWFKTPAKEDDEFVCGSDDTTFRLDDLSGMKVSSAIAERDHDYYMENKVRYICIDGTKGYAIVEGGEAYEVEFEYRSGEISQLICSCYCSYNCKHEFAAMLQLKETLALIEKDYADEYARTEYFAAVNKGTLFAFAIGGKETGTFTL